MLAKEGNNTYKLPKTKFEHSYDFSFSGIKTAVMNIANKEKEELRRADMCNSFEQNVVEVLVDNTIALMKEKKYTKLVLAGGVSANTKLREYVKEQGDKNNIETYIPDLKYCTDNAAMITCAGIFNYEAKKYTKDLSLNAKASLSIEE
jgi:N6-L-threonylcarbamoyladenine synthase